MVDLKELEQSLSDERIIELVSALGSPEYKETSDAIIFKTICHNENCDDASFKLYYYKRNKRFHCYTDCGCNFNIYELFKKRYELLNIQYNFFNDIVLKISDGRSRDFNNGFYEVYKSESDRYEPQSIEVNITPIKSSLLNAFQKYYTAEWLNEGISKETMELYNILYSTSQNKIIIPHYDINDNLIGIRGRALNPEDVKVGKYMPVEIEGKIYSHPLGYNLYGLNMNKDNIRRLGTAIVFEAEKSVMLAEEYLGRTGNISTASCGSNFSLYQFQLLRSAGAERIIIAYDNEGSNAQEREKYYQKLKHICDRYSNECLMGFTWDFAKKLKLKDAPVDRGEAIFRNLLSKGVVWIK